MSSTARKPADQPTHHPRSCWWLGLLAWALGVAGLSMLGNSDGRPLDEHEILVARTVTEMARRGDWVVPYFADRPRLQKLPLNYWLTALAGRALGRPIRERVDAFTARLPSALAAGLLVLAAGWIGWLCWREPAAALVSALLVGTSGGLIAWGHNARPEMVYAAFCTVQVAAFSAAALARQAGRSSWLWAALGWTAVLAATMSKGPHYPAFLIVAIGGAIWWKRRSFRELWCTLRPDLGVVVFGVGLGSYLYLLSQRVDGLWAFWYREMFYRTGGVHGAVAFFRFYYVGAVVQLTFPWSVLAVLGLVSPLRRFRQMGLAEFVAWCAVVVPAVVLSLSRGQRFYYLLPSLAPCLTLAAGAALRLWRGELRVIGRPVPMGLVLRLHTLFVVALAVFVAWRTWQYRLEGLLSTTAAIASWGLVGLVGAVCACVAWSLSVRPRARAVGLLILVMTVYGVGCAAGVFWSKNRYARANEARALGSALQGQIPVYALVGRIEHLVYYHDRPVRRVTHAEAQLLVGRSRAYFIVDERCAKCRALFEQLPVVGRIIEPKNSFTVRLNAFPQFGRSRAGAPEGVTHSSANRTSGSQCSAVFSTSSACRRSSCASSDR